MKIEKAPAPPRRSLFENRGIIARGRQGIEQYDSGIEITSFKLSDAEIQHAFGIDGSI